MTDQIDLTAHREYWVSVFPETEGKWDYEQDPQDKALTPVDALLTRIEFVTVCHIRGILAVPYLYPPGRSRAGHEYDFRTGRVVEEKKQTAPVPGYRNAHRFPKVPFRLSILVVEIVVEEELGRISTDEMMALLHERHAYNLTSTLLLHPIGDSTFSDTFRLYCVADTGPHSPALSFSIRAGDTKSAIPYPKMMKSVCDRFSGSGFTATPVFPPIPLEPSN